MKNDGTTPSGGDNGKRRGRHQWRPRLPRGPLHRPMWQEPVRGALYAAGSGIIALAFAYFQHWM